MAYSEQLWQDAKKKCRLTDEDIARAKRLGLNPRSLIKNIPSKSEPWKAPVSEWLREMEENGIVKREQYNEIPPHVEYSLTEKGRDLFPVFFALTKWWSKYY